MDLSYTQAMASIVEVGRTMFGLDWNFHEEGKDITVNTLPQVSRNRIHFSNTVSCETVFRGY